ncbi:MAG TPA: putative metal-dependent hydrolase [Planctomycetota bacterium]
MTLAADDPALEALRFPIGRFEAQESYTAADVRECLTRLELAPKRLAVAVRGLSDAQLDTPYRPGGWSARQVVHHLADSALHGSARFRWALTEEEPTIKPYDEAAWSALPDAKRGPIEPSCVLFEAVTQRLVGLLGALRLADWSRRFFHPEARRHWRLDETLALYAWHHEHHVAHLASLRARAGWKEGAAAAGPSRGSVDERGMGPGRRRR